MDDAATETKPNVVTKATQATKQTTWKYFGSMFMEPKGPNGEMGVSFHRAAGLASLGACWVWWAYNAYKTGALDSYAVYTTWMLLGLKGVSKVMELRKGNG